jgi:hypothetical protein
MNRKMKRALKKHMGAGTQEKMSGQLALFEKLPDSCDTCQKEFDKKDKDMILSWTVVTKQEIVRLFCPTCIEKVKEVFNERGENIDSGSEEIAERSS